MQTSDDGTAPYTSSPMRYEALQDSCHENSAPAQHLHYMYVHFMQPVAYAPYSCACSRQNISLGPCNFGQGVPYVIHVPMWPSDKLANDCTPGWGNSETRTVLNQDCHALAASSRFAVATRSDEDSRLQHSAPKRKSGKQPAQLVNRPFSAREVNDPKVDLQEWQTTLMLKNIPCRFNAALLKSTISAEHLKVIKMLHCPQSRKTGVSLGYAFVDFLNSRHARKFALDMEGKRLSNTSSKACSFAIAHHQGVPALLAHLKGTKVHDLRDEEQPLIFDDASKTWQTLRQLEVQETF